ncbi:MAG: tetratricopeptide repeat protein, partial [Planctomycetota bacterium]
SDYCNVGILYQTRGDLERAEEMYQKSLAINEALGSKEGMAIQYGNLGTLYQTRGDLERAEEMYQKSLLLFEELGSPNISKISELLNDLPEKDP